MQDLLALRTVESEAHAWRVRFHSAPPEGEALYSMIQQPRKVVATWEPIDPSAPSSRLDDEGGRSLAVLWLPPSASDRAAASWLEGIPPEGVGGGPRVVRAGVRTARVVWTNARAIIYTAPELVDDALDAVIRFTIAERDLSAIEETMTDVSAQIPVDAPLVHTRRRWDWRRHHGRIGRTTERLADTATSAMRLEGALEQLDGSLSLGSKRLYSELVLQGQLYDRLEVLERPIDYAASFYETINSRLIEAAQWSKSDWLVFVILVLLLAELMANVYPLIYQAS